MVSKLKVIVYFLLNLKMALSLARMCLQRAPKPFFTKIVTPSVFFNIRNKFSVQRRFISTTDKQKDAVTVGKGHVENSIYGPETENLRDRDEVIFSN